MSYAATNDQHDDHHGAPKSFFQRWCMSTNHKDIGSLYLIFALTMLFIGGSFAMAIRAELFKPGMQLMQPYFFNQLTSMHGLIMIFGAIMPAFVGLGCRSPSSCCCPRCFSRVVARPAAGRCTRRCHCRGRRCRMRCLPST